jgi:hypothetical protein
MSRFFFVAIGLALLAAPALAAPGGVFRNPVALWVILILLPILLPFAIYVTVKERKQIKKTEKDLAYLATAFPQYQWLTLRDRAQDAFRWMWAEWSKGELENRHEYATDWYWRNQQLLLDEWESKGLENVCDLHKIYRIDPFYVAHNTDNPNGEGSRVVVRIRAEVWDFLREKATGKVIKGEDKVGSLTTLWTFLWDGEKWRLDRIEEDTLSLAYTKIANIVPEVLNQPITAYNRAE